MQGRLHREGTLGELGKSAVQCAVICRPSIDQIGRQTNCRNRVGLDRIVTAAGACRRADGRQSCKQINLRAVPLAQSQSRDWAAGAEEEHLESGPPFSSTLRGCGPSRTRSKRARCVVRFASAARTVRRPARIVQNATIAIRAVPAAGGGQAGGGCKSRVDEDTERCRAGREGSADPDGGGQRGVREVAEIR